MASPLRPLCACVLVCSLGVLPLSAQDLRPTSEPSGAVGATAANDNAPTATASHDWLHPSPVDLTKRAPESPFRALRGDFGRFFGSRTNWQLLAATAAVALTTSRWDGSTTAEAREHLPRSRFALGNAGGTLLVQGGGAVATWAIGKAFDSPRLTALGSDLLQAQLVTQSVVQTLKFSVQRPRPDGSNRLSFPSGHTASSFATATVLQQHFGWKAGVPAYAFATYVGAARMAADKHHLSDVLMGAGIGLVAGRSVTMDVGGQRFDLGLAPTTGGAMVTFNRR